MPRPLRTLKIPKNRRLTADQAFALVLREKRLELGLTQEDLEDDNRLDRSYISKLELAKSEVGLKAIFHLAGRLGLRPSELIELVSERLGRKD